MKLSEYLKENKITYVKFWEKANKHKNISLSALSKWCQGQRIPRKEEMQVIYKITK